MRNISDIIEQYLKEAILQSEKGIIEIQRSEMADKFQCVPSQINYVISTRFSLQKGYLVESKRGGGGFIRIKKIPIGSEFIFYDTLIEMVGEDISQSAAMDILYRLMDEEFLTENEYLLLKAVITRDVINISLPYRDQIRANLLRAMLKVIFSRYKEDDGNAL